MIRLLLALCGLLAAVAAFQTWRLEQCRDAKQKLDTCEEVRDLNREIGNETDDDLVRGISEPHGVQR